MQEREIMYILVLIIKPHFSLCFIVIVVAQYFWRRRMLMGKPLIDEYNIGSIIIENPFYGLRKPDEQQ